MREGSRGVNRERVVGRPLMRPSLRSCASPKPKTRMSLPATMSSKASSAVACVVCSKPRDRDNGAFMVRYYQEFEGNVSSNLRNRGLIFDELPQPRRRDGGFRFAPAR